MFSTLRSVVSDVVGKCGVQAMPNERCVRIGSPENHDVVFLSYLMALGKYLISKWPGPVLAQFGLQAFGQNTPDRSRVQFGRHSEILGSRNALDW